MITQFMINFMNPKSHQLVRQQMMDAMSKILEFTNEERAILGLKPTDKVGASPHLSEDSASSIAEKLISFFMND